MFMFIVLQNKFTQQWADWMACILYMLLRGTCDTFQAFRDNIEFNMSHV